MRLHPLVAVGSAYLLGALPSADAVGRAAGRSVRAGGTGNPGAANAAVVLGRRWGALVAVADVAKGAAAVGLGRLAGGPSAHVCGTAAVVGHAFPPWGLSGGKGVATSYGAVLAGFPAYALPDLMVGTVAARSTRSARRAAHISCGFWLLAASVWWRRGWPTLGGPPATVALPLATAASCAVIVSRFRPPGPAHR